MDKKKIFVVDDDEFYLSKVESVLKNKYEVTTAKSGKDAMEYLLKGAVPDLILLDILLPDLDGWKTFHRIRTINFLEAVPLVLLIPKIDLAEVEYAKEIGWTDYITTPFKIDDLLHRLGRILRK